VLVLGSRHIVSTVLYNGYITSVVSLVSVNFHWHILVAKITDCGSVGSSHFHVNRTTLAKFLDTPTLQPVYQATPAIQAVATLQNISQSHVQVIKLAKTVPTNPHSPKMSK